MAVLFFIIKLHDLILNKNYVKNVKFIFMGEA